jgi:predicted transcriptional regulator
LVKRRSSIDIVGDLLQKASNGATMTRLMYECGLSYKVTKVYVVLMFEKGLLDFEPQGMTYRPSQKGLQYLRIYEEVVTMDNLVNAMKSNFQ